MNPQETYGQCKAIFIEEGTENSLISTIELQNSVEEDVHHSKECIRSSMISQEVYDKPTFSDEKKESGIREDADCNIECVTSSKLGQKVCDQGDTTFLKETEENTSTSEVKLHNSIGEVVDHNKTPLKIANGQDKAICLKEEEYVSTSELELHNSGEEDVDHKKECSTSSKIGEEETLLLQHIIKQLQDEILSLRRRRAEEGRANEKVVSIFASREYSWKAEKRKLISDQRRLWEELQRSFMDQQYLKQTSQRMRNIQLESECEECDRKEGFLIELKERFREQEFVVMASMEELKTEQEEKNALKGKLFMVESELRELKEKLLVKEKLLTESEARSSDLCKSQMVIGELQMAMAELQSAQKCFEEEKMQALQDLESALNNLTEMKKEQKHYEELVTQMSSEISILQNAFEEKEEIITEMLKKTERETEEKQELERQIAIANAKFLHAESEKEKWRKLCVKNSHVLKETNSHGNSKNRIDAGFDKLKELQRLHDEEIQELQSAFDEEVKFLQKKLDVFQEKASRLEQSSLSRKTKHKKNTSSLEGTHSHSEETHTGVLMVCNDYKDTNANNISVDNTALPQCINSDTHFEKQLKKWKKAYFASKATLDMLQKGSIDSVSYNRRSPALQDWLELEKARSKMEQMHLQEINAFDRQLKARDERMESFRQQLLTMEKEAKQKVAEIDELKKTLEISREETLRLHELLKVSEKAKQKVESKH